MLSFPKGPIAAVSTASFGASFAGRGQSHTRQSIASNAHQSPVDSNHAPVSGDPPLDRVGSRGRTARLPDLLLHALDAVGGERVGRDLAHRGQQALRGE